MTIGLMVSIFYIGYVLTNSSEKNTSIAPQKTKAQSANYSKFVAINTTNGSVTPTVEPPSPTNKNNPTISLSLTPTEIILAYQTITITTALTPSVTNTASLSATPANARTLPKTGFITNAIVLFGVSALVIFISFIF